MSGSILVGVDGSDNARKALDFAIELARCSKRKLLLVTGVELNLTGIQSALQIEIAEAHSQEHIRRVEAELLEPLAQVCRDAGVEVEVRAVKGSPAKAIVLTAQDEAVSQIVVGRRGASRWANLLLGSVASTISQSSPVPVTLVP